MREIFVVNEAEMAEGDRRDDADEDDWGSSHGTPPWACRGRCHFFSFPLTLIEKDPSPRS